MDQDRYPLSRGSDQLIRVNIVQLTWSDTFGYLVHPSIPRKTQRVADVATATGLWLCQLARSRPEIQTLHGFDISPASFLAPSCLPPKVSLQVSDASKPCPQALRGKYDFVHVRLVQAVVFDNDPSWMIQYCKDLLRPGGYLQWEEYDPSGIDIHVAEEVPRPSRLEELGDRLLGFKPHQWIKDLPKTLEGYDLSTIAVERMREAPWHRPTITYTMCQVFKELADTSLEGGSSNSWAEHLQAVAKEAAQETMKGSFASHMMQIVVSRKG